MTPNIHPQNLFADYSCRLQNILATSDWSGVTQLAHDMLACWKNGRRVFICGNGGSAGNAIHLANDFLYGIAKCSGGGLKVLALSANPAVLIVLSGSGNSPNILCALEKAKAKGVKSYAVLGFTGGKSKQLADVAIHFPVDDMQIAEDIQLIVGHMVMQWLYSNRPKSH